MQKTKTIVIERYTTHVTIHGEVIEEVEQFVYLGWLIKLMQMAATNGHARKDWTHFTST